MKRLPSSPDFVRVRPLRGSALVVSLVFIILLTILILGFATTAGLERKIVQSHYAKVQADMFATMGSDVAAARIKQAMSQGGWVLTQPGRIAYGPTNSTNVNFAPLISGTAASVTADVSVDMNPASLLTNSSGGIISGDATKRMPAKWIYVRQDGTQIVDPPGVPTYDAANPLIGRYAFWVDDLSARINLNAAAFSGASTPPASQLSHITLGNIFSSADTNALSAYRQNHLFESSQHAKAANTNASLATALDARKMDVTHYSHSPDLNVFGQPKIVLTTKASRANGQPFFDILTSETADPALFTNISPAKFNALFGELYRYFSRTDWPLLQGRSFVNKYGAENTAQLILNLIDYVRSAETESVTVEPSRGRFTAPSFSFQGATGGDAFMGNARRMLITQMGVWISDTSTATVSGTTTTYTYDVKFLTEVYLPVSAGDPINTPSGQKSVGEVNLLDYEMTLHFADALPGPSPVAQFFGGFSQITDIYGGSGLGLANRARILPGEFRTIVVDGKTVSLSADVRPTGPLYIRSAIRLKTSSLYSTDIAPLLSDMEPGSQAAYPLNAVGLPAPTRANSPQPTFNTIGVNDPVINKSRFDWAQTAANTLGIIGKTVSPRSSLGQAPDAISPQQDTDASGNLTDVGFGFPAVKGSSKNPRGMVESLGELGRIHTGGKGTGVGSAGVPWRTLRIQPTAATDANLPDWAMLNLFTVSAEARGLASLTAKDVAVLQIASGTRNVVFMGTNTTVTNYSVGGRVNVNTAIYPFASSLTRTAPLEAVLHNDLSGRTLSQVQVAATNIANGTLATRGRAFRTNNFQTNNLYLIPEQIAEIAGVADTGEQSEVDFRPTLPFLTTQSSTFEVYSIGQKISQSRNNDIRVQGQSRSTSLVEWRDGAAKVLSTQEPW